MPVTTVEQPAAVMRVGPEGPGMPTAATVAAPALILND
jgi:hypothetical protein